MPALPSPADLFFGTVQRVFGFLESEYGCGVSDSHRSGNWLMVTYANETAGVMVSWNVYDQVIFVYVIPLQDGQLPPYAKWWHLERLIERVDPSSGIEGTKTGKRASDLDQEGVVRVLTEYADLLRGYGDEVLRGDFSILNEPPRRDRQ